MSTRENGSPLLVCTACGRPAEPRQHLCGHCGAPMTPYAHTDPVMGIVARGIATHKATTDPQKPIVVIGIWLWMVPMLLFGLMLIRGAVGILIEGSFERSWLALLSIPVAIGGLMLVWIAGGILVKTTFRYLEAIDGEKESDKDEENVTCLQCGKAFAAEADVCPECGWTYGDDDDHAEAQRRSDGHGVD